MADTIKNDSVKPGSDEKNILNTVSKRLSQNLSIVKVQEPKHRQRARKSIIVRGDHGLYFVEMAKDGIQKFYLKRAVHYSKFFKNKIRYASINLPIFEDEINGIYFAVFPCLTGLPGKPDFSGERILKALYKSHTITRQVTPELLSEIEDAFLSSWPDEYHFYIRNLPEYAEYLEQLKSYGEIVLCPEHGDFALNNILNGFHSRYLIDFEFSRENQPSGFDLYAYRRTTYKSKLLWGKKDPYERLHRLKFELNDKINFAMDNHLSGVIEYPVLSSALKKRAMELLHHFPDSSEIRSIGSFLSSPFSPDALIVVTLWNNACLSGLAVFENRHNILYPVKTVEKVPVVCFADLYSFALFIKYLSKKGLGLHLNDIPRRSALYQQFDQLKNNLEAHAAMADASEEFKERALFFLLSEISGYLESFREKDHGDIVSISGNGNKKIIFKFLRNRISRIFRHSSRTLKTGMFIMAHKISVTRFILFLYQYPKIRLRWRRSRKRGGALLVRIGHFPSFIRALDKNGVEYVVLRGLKNGTPRRDEDLDLLLNASHIHKMIRVASFFPGNLPCDVYFDTYQSFKSVPYYPPAFALNILKSRTQNEYGCYVPDNYYALLSLIFHLTYHKGFIKGIDPDDGRLTPESKYFDTVTHLVQATGLEKKITFTLDGFHQFLKNQGCSMPYDLLVKWPVRHRMIDMIRDMEKKALLDEMPGQAFDLAVFIVREDARDTPIADYIIAQISRQFTVQFFKKLTPSQTERAVKYTRGGNWVELNKKHFQLVAPYAVVICKTNPDLSIALPDAHQDSGKTPYAVACSSLKNMIRKKVNEKFPSTIKRYAVHSADSPCEALDYLKEIYPETYTDFI